jgi:hypothetical protein
MDAVIHVQADAACPIGLDGHSQVFGLDNIESQGVTLSLLRFVVFTADMLEAIKGAELTFYRARLISQPQFLKFH